MEYNIGTVVTLKKGHPCGTNEWEIITFEKSVKKILQ